MRLKLSGIKIGVLAKPRRACGSGAAGKPAGIVTQRSHRGHTEVHLHREVTMRWREKRPGLAPLQGRSPADGHRLGPVRTDDSSDQEAEV